MRDLKSKSILFITLKLGGGGAERVTSLLANSMHASGYDVSVLAIDGEDGSYRMDSGLEPVFLHPSAGKVGGVLSRLVGISKYVNRNKPDVVVCLGGGYRYVDTLRLYDKAELVFSERNYPPMVYGARQMKVATRLCERASKVVFQTPEVRDCYPEDVRRKSVIIPNPVGRQLPWWVGAGAAERRIVTFCRLEPQKNLSLLVNAFAVFAHSGHGDWVLEIYGEGSQHERLCEQARDLGVSESGKIVPLSADIHELVRGATMFVSSSDFEGLQNSLIECMAMGMPCVATDCLGGGARMLAGKGSSRILLVPRGSITELAKAMGRVADNPLLAGRLSYEARKVREEFSVERICEEWIKLIEDGIEDA